MKRFILGLLFLSVSASANSFQVCKDSSGIPATTKVVHALASAAGPHAWFANISGKNANQAYDRMVNIAGREIAKDYFTRYDDVTPSLSDVCALSNDAVRAIGGKVCHSEWIGIDIELSGCLSDMEKLLNTL